MKIREAPNQPAESAVGEKDDERGGVRRRRVRELFQRGKNLFERFRRLRFPAAGTQRPREFPRVHFFRAARSVMHGSDQRGVRDGERVRERVLHQPAHGGVAARLERRDDFPLGIIARLSQAAAVCTPEGNLVWMNRKFAGRSQKHILISDNLSITSILDFRQSDFVGLNKTADEAPSDLTPKQLFQFLVDNSCGVTTKGFNFFGGEFTLYAYPLYSNKNFYLFT